MLTRHGGHDGNVVGAGSLFISGLPLSERTCTHTTPPLLRLLIWRLRLKTTAATHRAVRAS